MKNLKKYILSTFAVLACVTMLTGCGGGDKQKVMVCTPKDEYNANNGIQFEVADDGKTIEKIIYQEGYTKAFIEHWYPDADVDAAFNELTGRVESTLTMMTEGTKGAKWIDAALDLDKENYSVKGVLTIDVTDESFTSDEDAMLGYLKAIGFDKYYNADEKRFEVDPAIVEKSTADSWMPLTCELKEVKVEKTDKK